MKYLTETAIIEVASPLGILFIENGIPTPHDYITTLTNYNLRTDSEILKTRAKQHVGQSIVNLLFDVPSDTSRRIAAFIRTNRDNLPEGLTGEEAISIIRGSVKVETLEVIVPGTRALTPVYNVYIYPPTATKERLDRWRQWIAVQKYHADIYGVGIKYQHPFRCIHCKTVDHPSGLCPYEKARRERNGEQGNNHDGNDDDEDELLPMKKEPGLPTTRPKPPTPGPSQEKRPDRKGKGKATNPPAPEQKGKGQNHQSDPQPSKKRKFT